MIPAIARLTRPFRQSHNGLSSSLALMTGPEQRVTTPVVIPTLPYTVDAYEGIFPEFGKGVFVAPGASVIGDVIIGNGSSIWYNAALRADGNPITIGDRTNIQDGVVIHASHGDDGVEIGNEVTIGHMALIHGCKIGDRALIGMRATVMDGAVIEPEAIVAAGSLVTPGKTVPSHQLWAGSPAKYVRDLTDKEIASLRESAESYAQLGKKYLNADLEGRRLAAAMTAMPRTEGIHVSMVTPTNDAALRL